jgi:nanoRNase/pAp phosphatase (c-di-AMP/oligoRNAs hydrolase)
LRAIDWNISERTATAMLYAIKSDTALLRAPHEPRRPRGVHVPMPLSIRPHPQDGRRGDHHGAAGDVLRASTTGRLQEQVFCAFLGQVAREDLITYAADFFLQLEDVKWTILAGAVNDTLIVSVRNLGYLKNAGDFVKRSFGDLGSAGGHRSMAKAVVPLSRFREKYGQLSDEGLGGYA